jgi:diguanylate cyclase (GGDEF)-like protein
MAELKRLSVIARLYLAAAYLSAAGCSAFVLVARPLSSNPNRVDFAAFIVFTLLAAAAQLYVVEAVRLSQNEAPSRYAYHMTPAFLFAAVLLLPPVLLVPLVFLILVPEWLKHRYPWYIQTFNIATYLVNAVAAWAIFHAVDNAAGMEPTWRVAAAAAAAMVAFLLTNHLMVGLVVWLARGISPRESQVFSSDSLTTDLALLCLGAGIAVFWNLNPWLLGLGVAPFFLFYRALYVPRLQEEAYHDSKTGLLTARRFAELLREELARAEPLARPTSVIMADLDHLRDVNNIYGHLAGDETLKAVAVAMRRSVREDDPVSRFGGEEFCVLLRNTPSSIAAQVAERVRREVEAIALAVDGFPEPLRVTMSLGVATFPEQCSSPDDLLRCADIAVYRSKADGRNRTTVAERPDGDHSIPQSPPGKVAARRPLRHEPTGIAPDA